MDCQKIKMCFYIDGLPECIMGLLLPNVSIYQNCGDCAVGVHQSVCIHLNHQRLFADAIHAPRYSSIGQLQLGV